MTHHGAHGSWEESAHDYDKVVDALEPELSKATAAVLRAAHVGPGARVLDVACGPGHVAAAATAAGAHATGLDASPTMIEIARRRFPATTFMEGDMLDPPLGPWDAITCRMGAHHVDAAWIAAAGAVLKPGGWLAIAETGAVDDEARARDMRDPAEWIEILQAAGFEAAHAFESGANLSQLPSGAFAHATGGGDHGAPKGPIYIIAGQRGAP